MTWVLVIGGAWLTLASTAALLITRAIRIADLRQHDERPPTARSPEPHADPISPPVLRTNAAPALPRPRSGDNVRARKPRHRTRVNPVRNPLVAAERVPPTHSGTT